jgi:hypothetical protein
METTLKMRLTSKTLSGSGDHAQCGLQFTTAYQDGRNKEWASATPVADIKFTVKHEIGERFELGKAYTFTVSETDD